MTKPNNQKFKIISLIAILVLLGFGLFFVGTAFAQELDLGVDVVGETTGLSGKQDLRVTIGKIIRIILGFLGVIAIGVVLYGGFLYMTSAGQEEKAATARKVLVNGFIGLVIILLAFSITSYIISKFTSAIGDGDYVYDDGGGGGLGPFGGGTATAFIVKNISPSTSPPGFVPKDARVRIEFSKSVHPDTIDSDTIVITNEDTGEVVEGEYEIYGYSNNKVKFTPSTLCNDEACESEFCFDVNTKFKVTIKPTVIKSATGGYSLSCTIGSVCLGTFETGEMCDTEDPVITFQYPYDGAKVSQNALFGISVDLKIEDDGGVSGVSFYADDEAYGSTDFDGSKLIELTGFTWDTSEATVDLGEHELKAIAEDVDDHTGNESIDVYVLPAHCFDDVLDTELGEIIAGPPACGGECGSCDGDSCTSDADCSGLCVFSCDGEGDDAGEVCEVDSECDGDCSGICSTMPIITDIMPYEAGPGNLVSIAGAGFLSYDEDKSKIYFSNSDNPDDPYIEAELGCEGSVAWGNYQIVAKVPENAETGPLKLVNKADKIDTTDNETGWIDEFIFNPEINYPGLCGVILEGCTGDNCSKGFPGDEVKAIGENFGEEGVGDGAYFGDIQAQKGSAYAWADKLVNGLGIPLLLQPINYNVAISKAQPATTVCTDTETDEDCVDGEDNCVCEIIPGAPSVSNAVKFSVLQIETLPTIEAVNPSPAPAGQMITITGTNFGPDVGYVEFIIIDDAGTELSYPAALGCGNDSWANDEVIIKVPDVLDVEDYDLLLYTAQGLISPPVSFSVIEGNPGPGLCSLSPNNGPIGLGVDFIGENFGLQENYKIVFSGVENTTVDVVTAGEWTSDLINSVIVPASAVSGKVFLQALVSDSFNSNEVSFLVGSCSADSCVEGESCCANGACQAVCDVAKEYSPSEYMWLMSTGPLPDVPAVLERTCWPEIYAQSPSPYKGDEEACPNGMISATFNMQMKSEYFDKNIILKRCLVSGEKCDLEVCDASDCLRREITDVVPNDIGPANLNVTCTLIEDSGTECEFGTAGCECNPFENEGSISEFHIFQSYLEDTNDLEPNEDTGFVGLVKKVVTDYGIRHDLFKNTWYQVEIIGGEGGVGTAKDEYMPADYIWQFKTKSELCVPVSLLMKPFSGLIDNLDGKEKFQVSGMYKCQDIALNTEPWEWDVLPVEDPDERAVFDGYACNAQQPPEENINVCQVVDGEDLLRRDIGVYKLNDTLIVDDKATIDFETKPKFPVEIFAMATPQTQAMADLFDNLYKEGYLEIKFADPKVVSFYPECEEACINAELGAHFNTKMKQSTFTPENVQLYSCYAKDCVVLTDFVLKGYDEEIFYHSDEESLISTLKINLQSRNLEPNKYYRVVITEDVESYSGVKLTDLNYRTTSAPGGDCENGLDDDGDDSVDLTGGYDTDADLDLDIICGCYDTAMAQFSTYSEIKAEPGCSAEENITFACINLSNGNDLITEQAGLDNIKLNDYYPPDSLCDFPSDFEIGEYGQFDAFSWVFKTKNDPEECKINRVEVVPEERIVELEGEEVEYWSAPYAEPDACSASGQLLNAFNYGWTWASSELDVATISDNKYNAALPSYCSNKCLLLGSTSNAAICGNEIPEFGEECDDGNAVSEDGCSDKCLTEPIVNCSDPENQINCCGNLEVEGDEECDQGCVWLDAGNPCEFDLANESCKCVSNGNACTSGCLNAGTAEGFVCGNGVKDPGEDEDDGNTSGGDGLNSLCLNEGSKYKITDPEASAICGNQTIDPGEECEAVCDDSGVCSLDNNPNCNNKCVWQGFAPCPAVCTEQVECQEKEEGCVPAKLALCNEGEEGCFSGFKTIDCTLGDTDPDCGGLKAVVCDETEADCSGGVKIIECSLGSVDCIDGLKSEACIAGAEDCSCTNCCGNAIYDSYDGDAVSDEECEASCLKTTLVNCEEGEEDCNADEKKEVIAPCDYGTEGCECTLPDSCSATCLNLGSSFEYGSFCGDGDAGLGEDAECEAVTGTKGSPYQIATVPDPLDILAENAGIKVFSYDSIINYIFGSSVISTEAEEAGVPVSEQKSGEGDLNFRSNDPSLIAAYCQTDLDSIIDPEDSSPAPNAENVCLNAMVHLTLTEQFDSSVAQVKLYELAVDTCPEGDVSGVFNKIKSFVRGLFAKVGWAAVVECEVETGNVEFTNNQAGHTVVSVSPSSLLKPNKNYVVKLIDFKNLCDINLDPITMYFKTGDSACLLDAVQVSPQDKTVFKSESEVIYTANALSDGQVIGPVQDIYAWEWEWSHNNGSLIDTIDACDLQGSGDAQTCIVDVVPQDLGRPNSKVKVLATNGTAQITATATIKVDTLGDLLDDVEEGAEVKSTVGQWKEGSAQLTIFICDNLWNPEEPANNKWEALISQDTFTGDYFTTYLYETNYNVGLFYCRDYGEAGFGDDLPKLKMGLGEISELAAEDRYGIYYDDTMDWAKVSNTSLVSSGLDMDDPNQSWTIETWVFNEIMPGTKHKRIFYKNVQVGQNTKNYQLFVIKSGTERKVGFKLVAADGSFNIRGLTTDTDTLALGFNHIALTFDGDTNQADLYINGIKIQDLDISSSANWNGDNDLYIGSRGQEPGTSWGGYMDDFRLWSKERSEQEIQSTMNNKLAGSEDGLVGYWTFNEDYLDHSVNSNNLEPHCTVENANSKCLGDSFTFINISELAEQEGYEDVVLETTEEITHQCNDGVDNDSNGAVDVADAKCKDANDPWEQPKLLDQYFFVRDEATESNDDDAADVISLRIYENPEALPPDLWYQRYAPNPSASTTPVEVDCQFEDISEYITGKYCYVGAKDGSSLYMAAANKGGDNVYNNIYLLGYSHGSNEATLNIYSQLVSLIKYNINVTQSLIDKKIFIKDTKRVADMVTLRLMLQQYSQTHNGEVPQLDAGTYERGKSFSVWPSWQEELGLALSNNLAVDPENHFKWEQANESSENTGSTCVFETSLLDNIKCPGQVNEYQCIVPNKYCVACPNGYDKDTCYNSDSQKFYDLYFGNPKEHPVYSYEADPLGSGNKSAYKINFRLETEEDHNLSYIVYPGFE
ncbi:Ig-like domain-containing protein [Candidatus Kuenenbacteria bacterium]|nr:Ig-like domain-containing protein [Candidatus Kuenenbacteria bacterium]